MGAMEVDVGGAGAVKAVRELVVSRVRENYSGLWIARSALVAPEVGRPGWAIGDKRIREQTVVNLVQERDLHHVSESGAQGWPGADRIIAEIGRRLG